MFPERKLDEHFQSSPKPKKPQLKVHEGSGLTLFNCPNQPGNLRLSKQSCKDQFIQASKSNLEERPYLAICAQCKIGEINSGLKAIPAIPTTCVHCEQGSCRKILKIYCISCYNRINEFLKGKNARGAPPVRFDPLYLFEYNDTLIVIGKNEREAQRIVMAMTGEFKENLLINYGKATPQDLALWWKNDLKPWSMKRTKRISIKI